MTRTPFRRRGVHHHEMRRNSHDELDEILARGDGPLAEVLASLRTHADGAEAPAAQGPLATLLADGTGHRPCAGAAPAATPPRRTRRRTALASAGIALAVLGGTGVAGALPEPAQRTFDRLIDVAGGDRFPATPTEQDTPDTVPVAPEEKPTEPAEVPRPAATPSWPTAGWSTHGWPGSAPVVAPDAPASSPTDERPGPAGPGETPAPASPPPTAATPPAPAPEGRPATPAPGAERGIDTPTPTDPAPPTDRPEQRAPAANDEAASPHPRAPAHP